MIRGLHGLLYSSDAEASRAFFRDKLKLPFNDVGEGWLVFDLPEADLGVHPVDHGGRPGQHDLSFYCDDIEATVAELRARGVQFEHDPQDHGYGWVTYFTVPGGIEVQLYEPKYTKKAAKAPKARVKAKAAKPKARAAKPKARVKTKAKTKPKPRAKTKARR